MSEFLDALKEQNGYARTDVFHRYLRKAAFEKGIPLIGSFELTPRCNLDCKMCYVHLEPDAILSRELTTEQWIGLIDQACDSGMIYATLSGGECLLYPGFKEIYDHLQARGVLITILTNGTLLDEEMTAWFAERSPQRLQVSVYGSSPQEYEKVTGSGEAFFRVDKAIGLVKKVGIPFNLAVTVSKQLVVNFEDIFKYCQAKEPLSCAVTMFPFVARKETGRIYADYFPTIDEQVEIARIKSRLEGKEAVPYSCAEDLPEISDIEKSSSDTDIKGIPCTAGRIKFAIGWDGRMTACNIFDFAKAFPLKDGFINAWRYINQRAKEYHMPALCQDCKYKKACLPCPAIHWSAAGEGHVNPLVCEEAQKMVLAGLRRL